MKNYSNKASWAISLIVILITLFFLSACDKDDDIDNGAHTSKSISLDNQQNIYVNFGISSNAWQV